VSIDFGGGALHYFHRFMSWGGRHRGSQPADTDVIEGEREELVSPRYSHRTHPRAEVPGARPTLQPMGMRSECNGGRSAVFTEHAPIATQSSHTSYIGKIPSSDSYDRSLERGTRVGSNFTFRRLRVCECLSPLVSRLVPFESPCHSRDSDSSLTRIILSFSLISADPPLLLPPPPPC